MIYSQYADHPKNCTGNKNLYMHTSMGRYMETFDKFLAQLLVDEKKALLNDQIKSGQF